MSNEKLCKLIQALSQENGNQSDEITSLKKRMGVIEDLLTVLGSEIVRINNNANGDIPQ